MEIKLPSEFPRETVYFTPADLSFQRLAGVNSAVFERTVKLWTLLADTLVVAASHIFESPLTASLIMDNPGLLREGILVPSLRDDSADFREFVYSHRDKGDHTAYFKQNFEDLLALGGFLDSQVQTAYSWTFGPSSDAFGQSILLDLENPHSSLRRRLRGISGDRISGFSREIDRMPFVSRERLLAAATSEIPERIALLTSYWDTQYYLNSAAASCNPALLDAPSLRWLGGDFRQACSSARTSSLPEAFDELASRLGLSSVLLDMLDMDDVIELRSTAECHAFRKALWAGTRCELPEEVSHEAAVRLFLDAASRQLGKDSDGRRKLDAAAGITGPLVGMAGFALAHGPAPLAMTAGAFEVAGLALTVVGFKPILERLIGRQDPLGAFMLKMRSRAEQRAIRRGSVSGG